jgi:hypothetical protein
MVLHVADEARSLLLQKDPTTRKRVNHMVKPNKSKPTPPNKTVIEDLYSAHAHYLRVIEAVAFQIMQRGLKP